MLVQDVAEGAGCARRSSYLATQYCVRWSRGRLDGVGGEGTGYVVGVANDYGLPLSSPVDSEDLH